MYATGKGSKILNTGRIELSGTKRNIVVQIDIKLPKFERVR